MMLPEFKNEPLLDFTRDEVKERMKEALRAQEAKSGTETPLIIGGERVCTEDKLISYNPSSREEVLGRFQKGGEREVDMAIEAGLNAFEEWRWVSARERAGLLLRAAGIMRRRRFECDALMVLEVGKNWMEADADTAEAIDFLEFYAREAIRYSRLNPVTPVPGELNELKYIPLGLGAVIPPWNFPMAILCGMTSAAVAAGNTVILKPASDSPATASLFMEIMEEAGLPPGVINFVTGSGGVMGDYLVSHPDIRFIAFTGSAEVGLRINRLAAQAREGQLWIKRVIAEMGGKDFIIVDSGADLADALLGVVSSSFGFQGQKCSACSRLILVEGIYEEFAEELKEATSRIKVGDVREEGNWMGPVINRSSFDRIVSYIESGRQEGEIVTGGTYDSSRGYFIQPTIIEGISPSSKIAKEEIFGPVLAVLKARGFDEALELANDSIYGLTGSVYTKERGRISTARRLLHAGNLYFNRKCTGALVGGHPFGGFNMSGTDSKAGGSDYLPLFLQAKAISEKLW